MLVAVPGEVKDAATASRGQRSEVRPPQPQGSWQNPDPCPQPLSTQLCLPSQARLSLKSGVAGRPCLPGVILEDILEALTMMDIPVNDEDPGTDSSGVIRVWAPTPGQEPGLGREGASARPASGPGLSLQPD